jgi:hypothetical protein
VNKKSVLFAALALLLGAALFAWVLSFLPIQEAGLGIDWRVFWEATHGLRADYSSGLLFSPPWILPLLWPLTLFPFVTSWALAAFALLVTLILSVPAQRSRPRWAIGVLLLCLSYPALRQFADGNLEFLLIAGSLLVLWALPRKQLWPLAFGILLLSSKAQATWLFLLFLGLQAWKTLSRRDLLFLVAALSGVILPTLALRGREWLAALAGFPFTGSAIDSSLKATVGRLGAPPLAFWLLAVLILLSTMSVLRRSPGLTRSHAALLLTASLLLAPYAASNSVLTPLAIGVIPLFQKRPWLGILLLGLFYLPYAVLGHTDLRTAWEASYWTVVLLLTWLVLLWDLAQEPAPAPG